MTLVVTKKLVCDYPTCDVVKSDLVWWESSILGEKPWNKTKDGRHWCGEHTRDDITALLEHEDQEREDGS